jgi:hypothetical protein
MWKDQIPNIATSLQSVYDGLGFHEINLQDETRDLAHAYTHTHMHKYTCIHVCMHTHTHTLLRHKSMRIINM